MSEQENAQFMQGAYDKFNAGDIDGLLSMMADNVEWVLPEMSNVPFAGARSGHASVAAFFKSLLEHQEPKSFDVHGMIAQGNRVVAHGHYVWHVKATGPRLRRGLCPHLDRGGWQDHPASGIRGHRCGRRCLCCITKATHDDERLLYLMSCD